MEWTKGFMVFLFIFLYGVHSINSNDPLIISIPALDRTNGYVFVVIGLFLMITSLSKIRLYIMDWWYAVSDWWDGIKTDA